jgi:molecular chaperone GrpE (heat shock protein)
VAHAPRKESNHQIIHHELARHKQQFEIDALKAKEPSTKGDLRESELRLQKEIETVKLQLQEEIIAAKNQTLIWMFSMLILFGGSLIGIIARGFHW